MEMKERLNYKDVSPDAIKAMRGVEKYVRESGLERSLYELVKIRASQINGCAYCIDMHTKDARIAGETEQSIYALSACREKTVYSERLNYKDVSPDAIKAMRGVEKYVRESGLERSLYELVKIRASQINGCAYCIDMHTKDARIAGETEQRIYALSAWRETPFYSERE